MFVELINEWFIFRRRSIVHKSKSYVIFQDLTESCYYMGGEECERYAIRVGGKKVEGDWLWERITSLRYRSLDPHSSAHQNILCGFLKVCTPDALIQQSGWIYTYMVVSGGVPWKRRLRQGFECMWFTVRVLAGKSVMKGGKENGGRRGSWARVWSQVI